MMRVLLDTNVLLDSLLQRAPWHLEADEILRQAQSGVLESWSCLSRRCR